MAETKFTDLYEITPNGRVFSIAHNWHGHGRREMRQQLNAHGYPSVRLSVNGKRKRITVHRLVAEKFLGPRPTVHHEVRHLDGNKLNNRVTNLKWGTKSENAQDRIRHGTQFSPPWEDPDFRKRAIDGMKAAHARNKKEGLGRYAK